MKFNKIIISSICAAIFLLSASFTIQAKPGDLDPTFGNGGVVRTTFPNGQGGNAGAYISGSALQIDGKIVVVGGVAYAGDQYQPFVVRYNSDGSMDQSFGNGGIVFTRFPIPNQPANVNEDGRFSVVAVQPDGKIIAAGRSQSNYLVGTTSVYFNDPVLARYNTDGSLDTTFGNGGKVMTQTGLGQGFYASGTGILYSLIFATDGTFYAVGGVDFSFGQDPNGIGILYRQAIVIKYASNGGVLGSRFYNVGANEDNGHANEHSKTGNAAALQSDGKLVFSITGDGGHGDPRYVSDFVLMRVSADLTPDTTFGAGGTVRTSFGTLLAQARGIVIDPNGKITVSGSDNFGNNYSNNFYAARYTINGNLDETFGNGGKVLLLPTDQPLPPGQGSSYKEGGAIVRQPDGKYVIALSGRFGAIRLLPNGAVDTTFGSGGIATYDGSDPAHPQILGSGGGILLQPNGKIILPATLVNPFGSIFGVVIARLTNYARNDRADFDGEGKTDFSVVRSSADALSWYYLLSSNNQFAGVGFGATGDQIASADFDGDGKTDIAVFRPSTGVWYLLQSKLGFTGIQFGQASDIPVAADFDGDGRSDVCVFRPSNGTWYYLRSSDGGFRAAQFGTNGDIPVRGDFDRDGKADFAVFRPSNGTWYILNSADNSFRAVRFGTNGDVPIATDFDGDAGADISVFRPSNGSWYYLRSSDNAFVGVQFGQSGDIPMAGDFDGDGRADEAVFRDGNWYVLGSLNNSFMGITFGAATDTPVPEAYLP